MAGICQKYGFGVVCFLRFSTANSVFFCSLAFADILKCCYCITEVTPYKCTKKPIKRLSSKGYSDYLNKKRTHVGY